MTSGGKTITAVKDAEMEPVRHFVTQEKSEESVIKTTRAGIPLVPQPSDDPDDPLANDVANDWKKDEKAAIDTAKEWTAKYAKPSE